MTPVLDLRPDDYTVFPADGAGTAAPPALPPIEPLAQALIGEPYSRYDCWQLARTVVQQGWGITLEARQEQAMQHVQEVWWSGDGTDPRRIAQRWDFVVFRTHGTTTQHVGIMLDQQRMLHTRQRTGVCIEPLQRWYPRLVQLARLRHLPAPVRPAVPTGMEDEALRTGVHTVLVVSPLRGPCGQLRTVRTVQPVGRVLEAYLPPRERWHHVAVNGGLVPEAHWALYEPKDGDELWCYPQWAGWELLAYAGISLAIGLITTTISHALFRPKPLLLQPQNTMTQPEERTFSFEGIRTAVGPGAIIPVIYGRHRVGGQLLAASVDPPHFVYNMGLPGQAGGRTIALVWGGDSVSRIVVEVIGHGFVTGDVIMIQGVQGKLATNNTWQIEVLDVNVFALEGSLGRDAATYTGGGTAWRLQGGNNNIQRAVALAPTLSLLLALGEGEIDAILTETIKINDQPISNFPGVQLFTRTGTADQTPITELGETRNSYTDGRLIPFETSMQYTMTAPATGFVLNLGFLEGLLYVTESGAKIDNVAYLQYRWSVAYTGAWTNWILVPVAADRTAPVRIGIRQDNLPLALYQIEIWAHGGGGDGSVTAAFTEDLRAKWRCTLESVTEILGGNQSYPNTALLGLRALATEQLQGGLPNVTVEVRGIKVRVGSFDATPTWSDNTSWCVMDFFTNTRYGQGIPDAEIDLVGFATYGVECDSLIDGEARHRLNIVLDQEERLQPLLLTMLGGSRGLLLKTNGLWTPRATRSETPGMLVSWASCSNVRLTYTRDVDDINVMEARFANEDQDFSQDVMSWPPVALWPNPKNGHSIDLRGVTKPSRVQRALQYELNRRRFENVLLELDCAADAMPLQIHDLFRFAHPLPGWGISGRLQDGSDPSTLHLDQTVTLVGGTEYLVYVRHEDLTVEARPVLPVVLGDVTQVTLVTPLSQFPMPRTSVYDFGVASVEGSMRTFRVTSLQRKSDTTVHLEAVIHNPTIYDDPTAEPLPLITDLFNPLGPPPPLTALVVTEVVRIQTSGVSLHVVNLSWDVGPLRAGYAPYGGAMILRRTVVSGGMAGQLDAGVQEFGAIQDPQDPNVNFVPLTQVRGHILDWDDYTVTTGSTYVYRVIPISFFGVPNNVGALEGMVHVSGATTVDYFPGTPQNLRLLGQDISVTTFEGQDITFQWDPVPQSPLFTATFFVLDYLIQVWGPGQAYLLLQTVVPIGPLGGTVTWTYTYQQNVNDSFRAGFSGPRREISLYVWARTNTGRLSATPASKTVSNPAPDMSDIRPELTPLFEAGIIDWSQWVEPRDIDHYVVLLDTVNPPQKLLTNVIAGTQKYFALGLQADVLYYVQIVPWDTFGAGVASQINSFTPVALVGGQLDTTPPSTPTNLQLTTGTVTQPDGSVSTYVNVTWTASPEPDVSGYDVQVRIPPDPVPNDRTVGPTPTTTRFDSLPGGVTVYVKVAAYDKFRNTSLFTAEGSIVTGSDSVAPGVPLGVTATGSFRQIHLLWTPPADLDYLTTHVYGSQTNARNTAGYLGAGERSYHHAVGNGETWYYWFAAADRSENLGAVTPDLPGGTSNVTATSTRIGGGDILTAEAIITTAAQIDELVVKNSIIDAISADKITTGTLRATDWIYVGPPTNPQTNQEALFLDGRYRTIGVTDVNGVVRAVLGKLGTLGLDYGLRVWNALGQVMFDATDQGVTAVGIKAGVIEAAHVRTDVALITVAAQIANAIIGDAHITSLQASKILAGTINVLLQLGGNSIFLDGPNQSIKVFDQQFPQVARVVLGKLGAGALDYGLALYGPAGQALLTASGITADGIPTGIITAGHLRTDTAVITELAQIAQVSASVIKSGTIGAEYIYVGTPAGATQQALVLDGRYRNIKIWDINGVQRVLLGDFQTGTLDYGLEIRNAYDQVMWHLGSGATTQGITPSAVSATLTYFNYNTVTVGGSTEQAIIALSVPNLEVGDRVWVSLHANVTNISSQAITYLREDSLTGAVMSANWLSPDVNCSITLHGVFVASAAGTKVFVFSLWSLGSADVGSTNFVLLHLKR